MPQARPDLPHHADAGHVVLAHVAEQVAQVRSGEGPVRLDAPDAVHRVRVACRRLRSTLSTFAPLLDPTTVGPLKEELRWLAGELGVARDAEVMRDRLLRAMTDAGPHGGPDATGASDPAVQDARHRLDDAHRAAHAQVVQALDDPRYPRLLATLDALVAHPPLTAPAAGRAQDVLPRLVRRRFRVLRRLVRDAGRLPPGPERETLLHEARKAAKRARYAADGVVPVSGRPARRFAAAMAAVQEVLGEHQDSVVTRQRLEELAAATPSPAVAFAYGRLHAQEQARGEAAERRFDATWARSRRTRLRRWLR